MLCEDFETLDQYGRDFREMPEKSRVAGRGILIENNKILLMHELNTGVYMSPGGGVEEGETLEECCARELREETGVEVKPLKQFLRIKEYCPECLYISNYFICEKVGECDRALTETEVEHGAVPEWLEVEKALSLFGDYDSKRDDIASLYLREYTMMGKYLELEK